MIRKLFSNSFKKKIRLLQRHWKDVVEQRKYAEEIQKKSIGEIQKELEISIIKGQFFENKMHNLSLVAKKIDGLIIQPNEYFSFWKIVGEATSENGFKEGRNLIGGKISSDFGGGICQYSTLLYYFVVNTIGLKVIERHSHSLDIYKDHERFVPLGADATVSFGFKDFQFQNCLHFPIQFRTEAKADYLVLQLIANDFVVSKALNFQYNEVENGVYVKTLLDDEIFCNNFYKRL